MPQTQSPQPRPRIANTLRSADCVVVRSLCSLPVAEVLLLRSFIQLLVDGRKERRPMRDSLAKVPMRHRRNHAVGLRGDVAGVRSRLVIGSAGMSNRCGNAWLDRAL